MKLMGIADLALTCDCDERTVKKRIGGMPFEDGPRDAKLYQSRPAILKILRIEEEEATRIATSAEAARDLNVVKKAQIELAMEVTRKERIPLEDIEAINDEAFAGIAGELKANVGKLFTEELLNDCLARLREVAAKVAEATR